MAADGDTQNAVSGGIHIAIPVESVSSTQVIVLVNEDGSETVLPKSMLDDEGNMSRELILHHPDIRKYTTIWMDTLRNGTSSLVNTNKLVRFFQGATGLKTGSTDSALYCLSGTAERDGMPFPPRCNTRQWGSDCP